MQFYLANVDGLEVLKSMPASFGFKNSARVFMLLLATVLMWLTTTGLEGTEFSGGWLTGRLLGSAEVGTIGFVLALILTYWFSRVSAWISLVAGSCCLPLLLYFIAPGLFRSVLKGEYSVPIESALVWHWQPVVAVVSIISICAFSVATLFARPTTTVRNG